MKISEIEKLLDDEGMALKEGEYLVLKLSTDNHNNAQSMAQRLGEIFPVLQNKLLIFYGDTDVHILRVDNDA